MDWSDSLSSGESGAMDRSIIPPDLNDLPEIIDADPFSSPDWESSAAMDSFSEESRVEEAENIEGMSKAAVGGTSPVPGFRNVFFEIRRSHAFGQKMEEKINPLRRKLLRTTRDLKSSNLLKRISWEVSKKLADNKCPTKYTKTYYKGQSVYVYSSSKEGENPKPDKVVAAWERMKDKKGVFVRGAGYIGCGRASGKASDNRYCTVITCLVD
ncbi:hypothetical protein HDU67_001168 [Dinochytrium kinnereticum]|nr:hypothetical protein HDU67_001168 [Dinochytrium kinnereticum]